MCNELYKMLNIKCPIDKDHKRVDPFHSISGSRINFTFKPQPDTNFLFVTNQKVLNS